MPLYCVTGIREFVKELPGYDVHDWETLKAELKKHYRHYDEEKYSLTALRKLIIDAHTGKTGLTAFIARYSNMSEHLIAKGLLLKHKQTTWLLDGLSDAYCAKIFDYCTKDRIALSASDIGDKEFDFNKLKDFVLREADKQLLRIEYERDRSLRSDGPASPSDVTTEHSDPTLGPPRSPEPRPKSPPSPTSSATDPIAELTRQFASLALMIQQSLHPPAVVTVPPASSASAIPGTMSSP